MKDHSAHELREMSEHLLYEFEMLVRIPDALNVGGFGQDPKTVSNALIEAFAVHARALDHFLWGAPARDDVVADHYFPNGDWPAKRVEDRPAVLRAARGRANKEIAHVTYSRLRVLEAGKSWMTQEIIGELQRVFLRFADVVEPALVVPDFNRRAWALYRAPGLTTGTRRWDPTAIRPVPPTATSGFQS